MKSLSINAGSSASTISLHHNHTLRFLGPKPPSIFSLQNPISLSLSKPTCPTPSSSSSSPPSLLISPHFVPPNGDEPISNLAHYADIASKLAKDGLFEDFGMVVDCVLSSDVDRVLGFGKLLNLELVKEGIVKGLKEGRVKNVVGLLGRFPQLGIDLLGLLDSSAMELLKRVCLKIVNNGNLGELVELMETLAGFQFPIRELVKTNDVIKMFVDRRSPSLAVRYISLLPHADIMFCTIICEFGKKIDLVSSLRVFEASKLKMNGNNMYVYRTIIDVCGLCGDCYKSRLIYEHENQLNTCIRGASDDQVEQGIQTSYMQGLSSYFQY